MYVVVEFELVFSEWIEFSCDGFYVRGVLCWSCRVLLLDDFGYVVVEV